MLDTRDMSKVQSPDERAEGPHLPQAAQVEMSEVRQGQDAEAEVIPRLKIWYGDSYGDYTMNVPLKDLMDKQAWIAFRFDGKDLAPEHLGPARLLVPHLYLWKSAKWVRGITLMHSHRPGFWESLGTTFM